MTDTFALSHNQNSSFLDKFCAFLKYNTVGFGVNGAQAAPFKICIEGIKGCFQSSNISHLTVCKSLSPTKTIALFALLSLARFPSVRQKKSVMVAKTKNPQHAADRRSAAATRLNLILRLVRFKGRRSLAALIDLFTVVRCNQLKRSSLPPRSHLLIRSDGTRLESRCFCLRHPRANPRKRHRNSF